MPTVSLTNVRLEMTRLEAEKLRDYLGKRTLGPDNDIDNKELNDIYELLFDILPEIPP